ncbi:MAG: hypothetical protein HQK49_04485 [Oligoflexia bacterium]|nr:hypothetical protein [Oligoflexia bacterium]
MDLSKPSIVIDESKFPRISTYLKKLPNAINSYPDCVLDSEIYPHIGKLFPDLLVDESIDPFFKMLLGEKKNVKWVSEVIGNVLMLIIRTKKFSTDQEFLNWYRANVLGILLKKPFLKIILYVVKPSLAVVGATKRWGAMRRGTTFTSSDIQKGGNKFSAVITFQYPANLFNDPMLLTRYSFTTVDVIEMCGAKNIYQRIDIVANDCCKFHLQWEE